MIKKVELEITSDCNAACPGCARTLNSELLKINSFTLQDLQRIFPPADYTGVEFKFCGVLGDPAIHPEFVDMVEYCIENNGMVSVSTNGGVGTEKSWERLGRIAATASDRMWIHFCIDGHKNTNHIYRVNTKFSVIERNLKAFTKYAPSGTGWWIYIVFDHNEQDLEVARLHAEDIGLKFATRTGMRNSYEQWIAQLGKKNNKVEKKITTTKVEHSKKDVVKKLDKFITEYKTKKVDKQKTDTVLQSIVCKYIHEGEIFIGSDLTMWPCCFLYDSAFKNKEGIVDKLQQFEPNWNSLKHHSIDKIKKHPWFQELLAASWDPEHELHFTRCIRTCAKNKAYHNEINYVVK